MRGLCRRPAAEGSPHDFRQGHLYTWQRQARLSGQPRTWQATGWGPLEASRGQWELGYEEALNRAQLEMGAVSCEGDQSE